MSVVKRSYPLVPPDISFSRPPKSPKTSGNFHASFLVSGPGSRFACPGLRSASCSQDSAVRSSCSDAVFFVATSSGSLFFKRLLTENCIHTHHTPQYNEHALIQNLPSSSSSTFMYLRHARVGFTLFVPLCPPEKKILCSRPLLSNFYQLTSL